MIDVSALTVNLITCSNQWYPLLKDWLPIALYVIIIGIQAFFFIREREWNDLVLLLNAAALFGMVAFFGTELFGPNGIMDPSVMGGPIGGY